MNQKCMRRYRGIIVECWRGGVVFFMYTVRFPNGLSIRTSTYDEAMQEIDAYLDRPVMPQELTDQIVKEGYILCFNSEE